MEPRRWPAGVATLGLVIASLLVAALRLHPLATRADLKTTIAHAPAGAAASGSSMPHILYVLADDMGYNDIGYQSTDLAFASPTLDSLAARGVKLGSFYAQKSSSRKPATTVATWSASGASATSTRRSSRAARFDTHFGYYSPYVSYFSYIADVDTCTSPECFHDMHDSHRRNATTGKREIRGYKTRNYASHGEYSTTLFGRKAVEVVDGYASGDPAGPLFLYFAPTALHAPIECEPATLAKLREDGGALAAVTNELRAITGAALYALDAAVDKILGAFEERGLDDVLVIFSSDNGAQVSSAMHTGAGGSNFPLRGEKMTPWEGAVRLPSFVHWARGLPESAKGTTYMGLVHVTDWVPTILAGVLGRGDLVPAGADGVDQWAALAGEATAAPRSDVLTEFGYACGVASGSFVKEIGGSRFKLLVNASFDYNYADPTTPDPREDYPTSSLVYAKNYVNLTSHADESVIVTPAANDPILDELMAAWTAYVANRATDAFCSYDTPVAYDVFDAHEAFVVPWVDDADYMWTCAAEYAADSCASSADPALEGVPAFDTSHL
ncbi:sulfuric ester hydrolase [Aureococcus anophagefferens]|nr:sulfuric ester hydrolase [Aureococcus anophagefferens]